MIFIGIILFLLGILVVVMSYPKDPWLGGCLLCTGAIIVATGIIYAFREPLRTFFEAALKFGM